MTLPLVVSEAAEADLATAFEWQERQRAQPFIQSQAFWHPAAEREIPGKRYMRACGGAVIRYGVS